MLKVRALRWAALISAGLLFGSGCGGLGGLGGGGPLLWGGLAAAALLLLGGGGLTT